MSFTTHSHRPRRATGAGAVAAVAALALAAPAFGQIVQPVPPIAVPQPVCPLPVNVVPTGASADAGDLFSTEQDYRWVHSSTHLQGRRAFEKWAWGFFLPPAGGPHGKFAGFRTAVVVDNPDPALALTVNIEYYSAAGGAPVATSTAFILPEGFHTELATPLQAVGGVGAIRVVTASADDPPFVGATIHHSYSFNGRLDFEPLAPAGPPDARRPGLASMQQLQEIQPGATQLWSGPFPTTSTAAATHTFFLGNLPTFQVVNPNPAPNTLSVFFFGALTGLTIGPVTVTLGPNGSYMDQTLMNLLYNPTTHQYAAGIAYHDDWLVLVSSQSGLPILGEALMFDFYGPGLVAFDRFRMGSIMMANATALFLYNPELTYTGPPPVHTLMGIANVTGQDIGPVVIEYHDRRTNAVVTDVLATFPPGATQRIAPGEPGIVNYPVGAFDRPVRIRACRAGLIGWTMREVEPSGIPGFQQFRKVYGEVLDGGNGTEPGASFQVFTLGSFFQRKVAPLNRCGRPPLSPAWWPSYTNFTNFSVANVGPYFYRFFENTGVDATVYALQPFAGLRFADASFTFEDGPTNRLCFPSTIFNLETSGRVDHTSGSVRGIDAIGDPLYEWELGFPPPPPVYQGPGDVVPHPGGPFEPGGPIEPTEP
jgi:hypothetical protein